jgi:hypothetical protein
MKFLVTLLIIISTCFKITFAAEGCLIGSQLYTVGATPAVGVVLATDLQVYVPPSVTTDACFSGTSSTVKACFACVNGGSVILVVGATPLLYIVTCEGGFLGLGYGATRGTYYSDYVLECNLDDYSWTFAAAAGLFGVFVIKRRNKQ